MDLWGVGCVLFEVIALFPLFPGKNEMDQIKKIHNVIGTPSAEKFQEFKKLATHMEIKFLQKEGTGIDPLIPHASENCRDLIKKLLVYEEEDRISATNALNHAYFKEIREEIIDIARTPSICDSDYAGGEKDSKGPKKLFPVISKPVKNTSFSKMSFAMDKTLSKNLPHLKQSSPYAKKSIHKSYY
jgi:renal tumor antigen